VYDSAYLITPIQYIATYDTAIRQANTERNTYLNFLDYAILATLINNSRSLRRAAILRYMRRRPNGVSFDNAIDRLIALRYIGKTKRINIVLYRITIAGREAIDDLQGKMKILSDELSAQQKAQR
jgi:hypothetical protein